MAEILQAILMSQTLMNFGVPLSSKGGLLQPMMAYRFSARVTTVEAILCDDEDTTSLHVTSSSYSLTGKTVTITWREDTDGKVIDMISDLFKVTAERFILFETLGAKDQVVRTLRFEDCKVIDHTMSGFDYGTAEAVTHTVVFSFEEFTKL